MYLRLSDENYLHEFCQIMLSNFVKDSDRLIGKHLKLVTDWTKDTKTTNVIICIIPKKIQLPSLSAVGINIRVC